MIEMYLVLMFRVMHFIWVEPDLLQGIKEILSDSLRQSSLLLMDKEMTTLEEAQPKEFRCLHTPSANPIIGNLRILQPTKG